MPDFDKFERLFRDTMTGAMIIDNAARKISELAESNKVTVVKGKSEKELSDFLHRARTALHGYFQGEARFSSSDNNRSGKDLLEVNSRTHVELKSGKAMTDANSGLASVAWAIEDDNGRIVSVMKEGRDERRRLLTNGASPSSITASKKRTMDDLASVFSDQVSLGQASARLTHFIKCVATGITKSGEIQSSYEAKGHSKTPLLLQIDWIDGLVVYEKAFLPSEKIDVIKIERTENRAQVIAAGRDSGRQARLYPNYKNSWRAPSGQKFEASNWVETACFHVWIG
jgi:hypothetical protein